MPDPHLQFFLADSDVPCPGCGYNLRGLMGTRCPECNQELELRVGLVEPRLGAFIAGLVGISVGFGFCVLLLVWIGFMHLFRSYGAPTLSEMGALIVGAPAGGVALFAWLTNRRELGKLGTAQRWMAAAAVTALALIAPFWFMAAV